MFRIQACASFAAALATLAWGFTPAVSQAADRVLNVSSASTITTMDPYAESESQLYFIWCQVYGCLGRLDYEKKAFVGMLAEKWEVINNSNTWRFTLRTDLKRSDGGPAPTAKDVVHSWQRIMTDPESQQQIGRAHV